MTADALSDAIMDHFQADIETQLVRKKANEYVAEGICRQRNRENVYIIFAVRRFPFQILYGNP